MTDAEIISRLRNRGYPTDIDDDMIKEAIAGSIEYAIETYTDTVFGSFMTVADQQVYDLFSVGKELEGGESILDLFWSPFNNTGSLDVFGLAPFLQVGGYSFDYPSDLILYDMNWSAYHGRFSRLLFQATSVARQSSIRLIPTPPEARYVLARYAKRRTEADFRDERPEDFLLVVEAKCSEVLARLFASVAGIRIGTHADTGLTMKFWQEHAKKMWDMANDTFPLFQTVAAVERT